tara:strand:+ start:119 stop:472 length:354 start_codon:yes stop_codon:yes gene_type:complete
LAHEAVVGIGILDKAQALAGVIDLAQGNPYGFAILGRDQPPISRAEDAGEPRLDLRQQGQRGLTTTRLLSVHTDTVKIRRGKRRQRGHQKKGTPLEAKPQHMNGSFGKSTARPAEHC